MFFVELGGDVVWCIVVEVQFENVLYGVGFGFVDFQNVRVVKNGVIIEIVFVIVVVVVYDIGLFVLCFLCEVFEVEGVDEFFDVDVNFVDGVIDECFDFDVGEV